MTSQPHEEATISFEKLILTLTDDMRVFRRVAGYGHMNRSIPLTTADDMLLTY